MLWWNFFEVVVVLHDFRCYLHVASPSLTAASSSARSIACCLLFLALKALSATFSWSFFYIFPLSNGDSWNPIDMELIPIWRWLSEDEVFATNSFTL